MERTLLFAATEKGYCVCESLIHSKQNELSYVITFHEVNVKEDWAEKILRLCKRSGVKCSLWKEIKDDLYNIIRDEHITCAFAVSWKYYISLEINNYLQTPLIVFHDSLLPKYRGFAPTPTAIINGEDTIGITALFASDEIDCGDIIMQKSIFVPNEMYMDDIIKTESSIYAEMASLIMSQISEGTIKAQGQDDSRATYSIWRNIDDCQIDWNEDATQIYNMIRALAPPYLGAFTYMDGRKIIIKKAKVLDDMVFEIRNCGKFWKIDNGKPLVICRKGMLLIENAEYENGEKVVFNRLRTQLKRM